MRTDVGRAAAQAVAEVGDGQSRGHSGTVRRELEAAGLRRRIEAGVGGIDRFTLDAMGFLALGMRPL